MNKETVVVAVYGTLKRGRGNDRLLVNSTFIRNEVVTGWDMYSLGGFPGIVKGKGSVVVELYEVDLFTLSNLDRLEGYTEGGLHNHYERVDIGEDYDFGGPVYIYEYNYDVDSLSEAPKNTLNQWEW